MAEHEANFAIAAPAARTKYHIWDVERKGGKGCERWAYALCGAAWAEAKVANLRASKGELTICELCDRLSQAVAPWRWKAHAPPRS